MDGKIKTLHYGDLIIELPYEIEYDKKILESDSFVLQASAMLWYAIKNIMEEIVKIKENKIENGGERMKIKITEIEATAEDLRQSSTLADSFTNLLRRCLTPDTSAEATEDEDEEETDA